MENTKPDMYSGILERGCFFLMYQSQRPRGKQAGFWGNATDELISLQHLGDSTPLIGNHSSSAACDYIIIGRILATRFFSNAEIYDLP